MNLPASCPDPVRLKELLSSGLPEQEHADLIGHLDSCECCQHSLEEIAAGGSSWTEAARELGRDRPHATSAYWPALQKIEDEIATRPDVTRDPVASGEELEEFALDFLTPADGPDHLGKLAQFEVVEVVGHGGMGVVLKALDPCLERYVALKVLDPKLANNELARKRFCREARAAAAITHENVVAIHQVEREETRDLPFLVMQLVTGESLQARIDRVGPLPLRDILRIGVQLASGLAAAHAQGLIHRDIKPANILLEPLGTPGPAVTGERPRTEGERVKLTDFGLARAAEDVKLTQTGMVAGTPLYMAPEQARGEPLDHRTDLFSLGSVMYAMCTGKPPFHGSTPFLVLRQVTEEQPPPIQTINPQIPDWLVGIIDKLQAKKPEDRFQSATEVVDLLARHLACLPPPEAPAAPTPRPVRTSAPPGRGRRLATLAAVFALGLAAGLGLGAATGLHRSVASWFGGDGEDNSPKPVARLHVEVGPIWSVAFSPDGNTLALAIDDGTIKLYDPKAGRVRATLRGHKGPVWSVDFSKNGELLGSASDDGTVKLWDPAKGKELRTLKHDSSVRAVAFAPDGKRLATGSRDGSVLIWDLDTDQVAVRTRGHKGAAVTVAYAPDGSTVASGGSDKHVKLWDAGTGEERLTLERHLGGVYSVAFSADGKKLATGSWDHQVRVWDVATGDMLAMLKGHTQDVWGVAFAPDGRTLASASEDRTVKIWDVDSGKERATLRGHTGTVYSLAFSRDGRTLASGGRDGILLLWDPKGWE
jgi:serine/threonine protein kinase